MDISISLSTEKALIFLEIIPTYNFVSEWVHLNIYETTLPNYGDSFVLFYYQATDT